MSTYLDSPFWAGSPTDSGGIWIRNPVKDGEVITGGGLNEAMRVLDQARKEVQAIENVLGLGLKGSAASLAARLAQRVSPSGIGRGQCIMLRTHNTTPGTYNQITNWYVQGASYVQFGKEDVGTGQLSVTITYPKSYFSSNPPTGIICCFADRSAGTQRVGQVQLDVTSIGLTTFRVLFRQFDGANAWTSTSTLISILWAAFGGFPSS